jgi:hypothetical protein
MIQKHVHQMSFGRKLHLWAAWIVIFLLNACTTPPAQLVTQPDSTVPAQTPGAVPTDTILPVQSPQITPSVSTTPQPSTMTVLAAGVFQSQDRARITIQLQSLHSRDFADGHVETRGSNSIWQYATIANLATDAACGFPNVYILSRPPRGNLSPATLAYDLRLDHASIVMVTNYSCMEEAESQANDVKRLRVLFSRVWEAPRDIGTLTITAIEDARIGDDGPAGAVRFTTSTGMSGTLDIRSAQWSLNEP